MEVVSFDLAVKLKEKGFREECVNFYRNKTLTSLTMIFGPRVKRDGKISFNSMEFKLKDTNKHLQVNIVDAPTISQVLKWLRDEKKIYVQILYSPNGWEYITLGMTNMELRGMCEVFKTYEQAALAGISYVLDNLI